MGTRLRQRHTRRAASCAIAMALALCASPAPAGAAVQPALAPLAAQPRVATQELVAVPLPGDGEASGNPSGGAEAETPGDADVPADGSGDGGEAAIDRARRLIDDIPYDPYKVSLQDADAIHAAEDAYALLTEAEQQQLDAQEAASGVLTYGRALQCASWGLDALMPVDDSTALADGTYTTQVTSTCEMGKSNSVRGYKFTVAKVTVKGGHATATLEHATASPNTVRLGGVVYPHSNTDEKARSTFEVPVDLNSMFHFSQMAKNPTANTMAIPYEMMVEVDEEKAVPDPVAEGAGKGDDAADAAGTAGTSGAAGKPSSPPKAPAAKPSGPPKAPAVQARAPQPGDPAAIASAAAPAADAASAASGGKGGPGKDPASTAGAKGAAQPAPSAPADDPAPTSRADVAATMSVEQADELDEGVSPDPDRFQAISICAAVLLAIGLAAFPLDYLRRDRKPVQVAGVRLSDVQR